MSSSHWWIVFLMTIVSVPIREVVSRSLQGPQGLSGSLEEMQRHLDPEGNHLVEDDGSMDAALINYLYAKQIVKRISNGRDVDDLQRKRSYWKQCAFNAVSCFGKK